jgi:hypothetical protein
MATRQHQCTRSKGDGVGGKGFKGGTLLGEHGDLLDRVGKVAAARLGCRVIGQGLNTCES